MCLRNTYTHNIKVAGYFFFIYHAHTHTAKCLCCHKITHKSIFECTALVAEWTFFCELREVSLVIALGQCASRQLSVGVGSN